MQGIENLGSTCAINSLIQIIARNDILRNIILNNNFAEDTISDQLKEIIDLMYVKNNSIIPRKFINTLYNIFKDIFYQGEQIDIGELWTFLSDKISDDMIAIPETNNINSLKEYLKIYDAKLLGLKHWESVATARGLEFDTVIKEDREYFNIIASKALKKAKALIKLTEQGQFI